MNIYIHRHFLPWLRAKLGHHHRFEAVEEEILDDPTWLTHCSANQKRTEITSCHDVTSTHDVTCTNDVTSAHDVKISDTAEEVKDSVPNDVVHLRPNNSRKTRQKDQRHSAYLESSLAKLNSSSIGHFSMSLPDIESEIESLKHKEWNRRSYVVETDCFL